MNINRQYVLLGILGITAAVYFGESFVTDTIQRPLLALDAVAVIVGPNGERRVPFDQFFFGVFDTAVAEDEILAAIEVPQATSDTRTRFFKFNNTSAESYSTVTTAISLSRDRSGRISEARIGLGSVAPIPIRARAAEDMLRGQVPSAELISG